MHVYMCIFTQAYNPVFVTNYNACADPWFFFFHKDVQPNMNKETEFLLFGEMLLHLLFATVSCSRDFSML